MVNFLKVVDFWNGCRKDWFRVSSRFDKLCVDKFKKYFDNDFNFRCKLKNIKEVLGVILLYDQLSRNIFRGTPDAYKYDSNVLKFMLNHFHMSNELDGWEKIFFLMPLKHSEDLYFHKLNVKLWKSITDNIIDNEYEKLYIRNLKRCEEHLNIIKIYGRFPKRNKYLSRENTIDENIYLEENLKGFI